ncbi:MAG: bifunctional alpha/beta hydrolase/OsmC family protein [Saprospiraceae bacterium]|nr:bifunctional alpha/beta hydrolase/OsmC family protein [Saprospiraceae bacterium]
MKRKKLEFVNREGLSLSAYIEFPSDQEPDAFAIFGHCFTCNKNLPAARNIARAMASRGIAVLGFDFAGLGESEGEFIQTSFLTNVTDIIAAAAYLESSYRAPAMLVGHSLGGAATLYAAAQIQSVKGVVSIGAPSDPNHVLQMFGEELQEIRTFGKAKVQIAGRQFDVGRKFLQDVQDVDLLTAVRNLRKAILILHSPLDTVVAIDHAFKIYQAAYHPKSFISLDRADHILSDKEDSIYAGEIIAGWAARYLDRRTPRTLTTDLQVVASLPGDDNFSTLIRAGRHYLTADEPESVGGNDYGPTPYHLLTSALGSCTAMTLQMYARRKGWDLQEVLVHLKYQKIYAEDCELCVHSDSSEVDPKAKLDHIDRAVELIGNLDDKQRNRLLEIAERCPVHRTLESEIHIHSRLAKSLD